MNVNCYGKFIFTKLTFSRRNLSLTNILFPQSAVTAILAVSEFGPDWRLHRGSVMSISNPLTALGQSALERTKASHALDSDAAHFYHGWARSDHSDVGREEYCAPTVVAELASAVQTEYLSKDRAATEIVDVGCGTGLVGGQLKRLGFSCPTDSTSQIRWRRRLGRLASAAMSKAVWSSTGPSPIRVLRHYGLLHRFHARARPTPRTARTGSRHSFERFRYHKYS
ncbi:hypothetical protein IQ26_06863 [Mesorhizobium tianshanense]|uniref:Methyltransferase family protein n=1 Tax=Mesorhizobium tianshanense TaxID=39844 RepID=A0A562MNQ7_9HYPH|nr:hypothetical protein IQ26_06863 [Mesorhizobium tianshanense]